MVKYAILDFIKLRGDGGDGGVIDFPKCHHLVVCGTLGLENWIDVCIYICIILCSSVFFRIILYSSLFFFILLYLLILITLLIVLTGKWILYNNLTPGQAR